MDDRSEKLLTEMLSSLHSAVDEKFRKGKQEHGGFIGDIPTLKLIDAALDEAIDQYTYLYTLKQQLLAKDKRIIDV